MTTNPALLRNQNHMWALRQEMGLPLTWRASHSLLFTTGEFVTASVAMELAQLALRERTDLIYATWPSGAKDPVDYTIVLRDLAQIDVIGKCVPYAPSAGSPLTLIAEKAGEQFAVGDRGILVRLAGEVTDLAYGRRLATARINGAAMTMGDTLAANTRALGDPDHAGDLPTDVILRLQ